MTYYYNSKFNDNLHFYHNFLSKQKVLGISKFYGTGYIYVISYIFSTIIKYLFSKYFKLPKFITD